MAARTEFSVFDVLDLPLDERDIFLYVARTGPVSATALAAALNKPNDRVETLLERLQAKGRIRRTADGDVDVQLGHIARRTTLPAQLWLALLAPQRLYSEQEIAILKVAIPMLQFVRATLSSFADHGHYHALRVKTFATQLGYALNLTDTERRYLRTAALFHDIGNVIERERHHLISQETVERLAALDELPLSVEEVELVGLLCRWHRKEYDPERVDVLRGETLRTGIAASVLRVADALDIDSRRSDYDQKYRAAMEFFFPEKRPYFTSLEEIFGVRILCASQVNIQVFTRGVVRDNIQIEQLYRDLAATPLGWSVQEISVPPISQSPHVASAHPSPPAPLPQGEGGRKGRALVAFPFDAHSLVMAALSERQLERAGYSVEVLCYPDTPDGSSWLWRTALGDMEPSGYEQLVVIGDRPDLKSTMGLLDAVEQWRAADACVNILNRHEANWARIPELRARGAAITLGTDWAYFWGDAFTETDFVWATLAALATRDPTMASTFISQDTERVLQGLLCAVFHVIQAAERDGVTDTAGWLALAQPLMKRIAANDRAFFTARADEFVERYITSTRRGVIKGRVLVFEDAPVEPPQAIYWMLEAAMEREGFSFVRELRLRVPYAIATHAAGEHVELVAMNHWRAEHFVPIRLLYPDAGPSPQGTESTVTARLTRTDAALVIARLVEACNRA